MSASSRASSGDFGRRFEHDAAPGEQRGHQLGGDQELRHVPRHDRGDDADGFAAGCGCRSRRSRAGSPATGSSAARSQNALIIINGRPTCARWAKVIGAPISVVISCGHLGAAARRRASPAGARRRCARRGSSAARARRRTPTAPPSTARVDVGRSGGGDARHGRSVCGEITSMHLVGARRRPRPADEQPWSWCHGASSYSSAMASRE